MEEGKFRNLNHGGTRRRRIGLSVRVANFVFKANWSHPKFLSDFIRNIRFIPLSFPPCTSASRGVSFEAASPRSGQFHSWSSKSNRSGHRVEIRHHGTGIWHSITTISFSITRISFSISETSLPLTKNSFSPTGKRFHGAKKWFHAPRIRHHGIKISFHGIRISHSRAMEPFFRQRPGESN